MSEPNREELEQALAEARAEVERARAKSQERADLLATMSHEIRTPMNGIIGMAHLLLEEPLEGEQRSLAEVIKKSALALLKLLNDTLDYSKLDAGRLEIERLDFDLRVTIDEVAALLAPLIAEKSLGFNVHVHHDVPSLISGDPGRLRQVLFNLAGNAIKFTEEGSVGIVVDRLKEDEERVTLRFTVSDTGIGMNEAQLSKLFEAYEQADATISRRFGGTGLGLSVSRQLVSLMGGDVGVESEPGRGSSFWFRIPFAKQAQASGDTEVEEVELEGLRVLVADPSEALKPGIVPSLNARNVRVELVESGERAITRLREAAEEGDPFKVAFLEMDLPDTDGMELGGKVRATEGVSGTRLVLLTNVGRKGDAARAHGIGFSAYLTKPVLVDALHEALAEVMRREPPTGDASDLPIITRHSVAEARRSRLRLLVVEDDRVSQLVTEWTLRRQGFTVEIAVTGSKSVEACDQRHYDLILMDMHLPDMDGFEALAKLKGREDLDETPIIAMTADAGDDVRRACLGAGFDDYLSKPVDLELLSEKVRMWTGVASEHGGAGAAAFGPRPPKEHKASPAVAVVVNLPGGFGPNGKPKNTARSKTAKADGTPVAAHQAPAPGAPGTVTPATISADAQAEDAAAAHGTAADTAAPAGEVGAQSVDQGGTEKAWQGPLGPRPDPEFASGSSEAKAIAADGTPTDERARDRSGGGGFDPHLVNLDDDVPSSEATQGADGADGNEVDGDEAKNDEAPEDIALDVERLEESSMGIPSLRASLLKTFIDEMHPRIARLAAAITSGDARLVEFEAHGLKGMSATIGAVSCARCFAELERLGNERRLDHARPQLQKVRVEVERAQAAIEALGEIPEAA